MKEKSRNQNIKKAGNNKGQKEFENHCLGHDFFIHSYVIKGSFLE